MKSQNDEAIVVGMMDYRESDRIVHLYAKEHGRLSGVARGAKKSVKRFGGAFELFARISFSFLPAENLVAIGTAEPLTIYPGIRASLAKIAHASYACELVTALTPEKLPNSRVYRLLSAYLEHLDISPEDPSDRHFLEINLLNILGYRPPLDSCQGCGAPINEDGGFWSSHRAQGIFCAGCSSGGARIEASSISLLLAAMKTGRFGVIRFNAEELGGVERFMEAFIAGNIGRPLKSLAFLRLSP